MPPDLVRHIHHLEIRTRRLAQEALAGGYRSAFRGAGLDFDEVRPYMPGDDVRHINWPVTARTGDLYVKRYAEERQLTLLLLVDVSGSTQFGSGGRLKQEVAIEVTAVLAAAATFNQDRVGLVLFSDRVEALCKPGQGRKHTQRLLHQLLTVQPHARGTDLSLALQTAGRLLKRRAVIVIVSDFLAAPESYWPHLAQLSRRHDVLALALHEPLETDLADVGLLPLQDAETGQVVWVDSSDRRWQMTHQAQAAAWRQAREDAFRRAQVDSLPLATADDVLPALVRFFRQRGGQRIGK